MSKAVVAWVAGCRCSSVILAAPHVHQSSRWHSQIPWIGGPVPASSVASLAMRRALAAFSCRQAASSCCHLCCLALSSAAIRRASAAISCRLLLLPPVLCLLHHHRVEGALATVGLHIPFGLGYGGDAAPGGLPYASVLRVEAWSHCEGFLNYIEGCGAVAGRCHGGDGVRGVTLEHLGLKKHGGQVSRSQP